MRGAPSPYGDLRMPKLPSQGEPRPGARNTQTPTREDTLLFKENMNLHEAWDAEFSRQSDKDLQTMAGYLDDAEDEIWTLCNKLAVKDIELYGLREDKAWQKIHLQRYQRELAAAKTWTGICRTIVEKLDDALLKMGLIGRR